MWKCALVNVFRHGSGSYNMSWLFLNDGVGGEMLRRRYYC